MGLPLGALTSLTGGGGLSGSGGASTSGDAKGGSISGNSGISSPVVIGGYKSDGSATAVPQSTLLIVAAVVAVALFLYFRRK